MCIQTSLLTSATRFLWVFHCESSKRKDAHPGLLDHNYLKDLVLFAFNYWQNFARGRAGSEKCSEALLSENNEKAVEEAV